MQGKGCLLASATSPICGYRMQLSRCPGLQAGILASASTHPCLADRAWCLSQEIEQQPEPVETWRFSVASYNILADKYAQHYRSYLYREVSASYLDWHHRRSAIIAELAHLQPDIICLQEVDRYDDLQAELQQLGYSGMFMQRDGGRRDGCATFWRSALLKPALVRQLRYSQYDLKDNVALLTLFEPRASAAAACRTGFGMAQQWPQQEQHQDGPVSEAWLHQQQQQHWQQQPQVSPGLLGHLLPSYGHASSHHSQLQGTPHHSGWHKHSSRSGCDQGAAEAAVASMSFGSDYAAAEHADSGHHRSRHSGSRHFSQHTAQTCTADSGSAAVAAAVAAASTLSSCSDAELQPLPKWHCCAVLVANTHHIFTPDKGDVKLGQGRVLLGEVAQMADVYLQHQQQQPRQQQRRQQQQGGAHPAASQGSNKSSSSSKNDSSVPISAVATILTGDFNAVPGSPMYAYLAHGQLDLLRVNKRNVAHMSASAGRHKGYRAFKRQHKSRTLDRHGKSLEIQQLGKQQQQHVMSVALTADGRDSAQHSAGVEPAQPVSSNSSSSMMQQPIASNSSQSSSDSQHNKYGPIWPQLFGVDQQRHKHYRWSDRELKRAAGMTYDQLLEASNAACHVAATAACGQPRSNSPNSCVARAAAAFGAKAVGGAGAAAAAAAAVAAVDDLAKGLLAQTAGSDKDDGPLLLQHHLQLRSAYEACLGQEPDYTSSHTQFMDTCDYIWYGSVPRTLQQHRQQQPQAGDQQDGGSSGSSGCADSSKHLPGMAGDAGVAAAAAAVRIGAKSSRDGGSASCTHSVYELRPVAVLTPPDGMKLSNGLPTQWLGSDHICLMTEFELSVKR